MESPYEGTINSAGIIIWAIDGQKNFNLLLGCSGKYLVETASQISGNPAYSQYISDQEYVTSDTFDNAKKEFSNRAIKLSNDPQLKGIRVQYGEPRIAAALQGGYAFHCKYYYADGTNKFGFIKGQYEAADQTLERTIEREITEELGIDGTKFYKDYHDQHNFEVTIGFQLVPYQETKRSKFGMMSQGDTIFFLTHYLDKSTYTEIYTSIKKREAEHCGELFQVALYPLEKLERYIAEGRDFLDPKSLKAYEYITRGAGKAMFITDIHPEGLVLPIPKKAGRRKARKTHRRKRSMRR